MTSDDIEISVLKGHHVDGLLTCKFIVLITLIYNLDLMIETAKNQTTLTEFSNLSYFF